MLILVMNMVVVVVVVVVTRVNLGFETPSFVVAFAGSIRVF